MRRTDVVVAAVALFACAVAFGLTFRFATMPAAMVSGLGAEAFPRLVIGVIALLAVLAAFGIGNPPMETPPPVPPMVWMTAAVLLAFVGAVELVGMWPSAIVFLVGLGLLWGERSLWKLTASALALCAVLYGLFVRVLGGNFPKGLIANLWS
ncbi:MAG: tripartite tricarboxylate transporter TctB family protein [Burkholderiaceae bacterium]|nr:tripartite tricarboxylate transporter TctB family protein [Burkholderiaceae bacterium]